MLRPLFSLNLAYALVLIAQPACTKWTPDHFDASTPPASEADGGGLDAALQIGEFAARDPDYLFDEAQVRTYDLRLAEADLAYLDQAPMAEQYVPGELLFEGQRVKHVGIRYKGSVGSFVGCLDGGYFPPRGAKSCTKLSIKVKIDYADPEAKFFGQKKLLFHAMNGDRTLLRERFGYAAFRDIGVAASRTAHVRLRINGQLSGLYLLVEEIDGRFIRARFDDGGEGNLYKEAWPISADPNYYLPALETNRKDNPSTAKMATFARQLMEADDEQLPSVLEEWLDLDYMARYVAADRMMRHDDGPYHWYCGQSDGLTDWRSGIAYADTVCGNHNYYWYEDARADRLWPIPWDLDNAMPFGNGYTTVLGAWNDLSADCTQVIRGGVSPPQMPPTCDPLQRGIALSLRPRVRAAMVELARGPFSDAQIDRRLNTWAQQITPYVTEAFNATPDALSPTAWRAQVDRLRETLVRLRTEALPQDEDPDAGPLKDSGVSSMDAGPDAAVSDASTGEDAGDGATDAGAASPDAALSADAAPGPTDAGQTDGGGSASGASS